MRNILHGKNNTAIIQLIQKYHNSVLLEISGHDHIADLRYNLGGFTPRVHTSENHKLMASPSGDQFMFHNILIAPGATSASFQNPGYTTFTIDDSSLVQVKDLKMVFLSLSQTYGWKTIPDDFSKWPFRTLDFT